MKLVNRPIVLVSALFILGILFEHFISLSFSLLWISACFLLFFSILNYKKEFISTSFLFLSFIFLGGLIYENARTYTHSHIKNFISIKKENAILRGVIISDIGYEQTEYGKVKTSFLLSASRLKKEEWDGVTGLVSVAIYDGNTQYRYGDEVVLEGILSPLNPPTNPGQFDYRKYLHNQGIYATFKSKYTDAHILVGNSARPFLKFCYSIRNRLKDVIEDNLPPQYASLLSAILLGDRSGLGEDLKEEFIKTGTVHILAISGLHIGLVGFCLFTLFLALRIPRRAVYSLVIIALIFYTFISGARSSIIRATVMASVFLSGMIIRRESDILTSLGLSALLVLLVKPHQLFDPGFQLSFLSVGSIVYITPRINSVIKRFIPHSYISNSISVSIAAWLGVMPVVAHYFNIVSPVALISNLIIVPMLGVVIASGISLLVASLIFKPLALLFSQATLFFILSIIKTASIFSLMPFAYFRIERPSLFIIAAYYVLLSLIFEHQRLRLSKARLVIILLLSSNIFIWKNVFESPPGLLRTSLLDVGHGDSVFIEFPYKGTMLIDGGQGQNRDTGRRIIAPFLWNKGISRIDYVVLTHPESDHVGGLVYILNNFDIGCVIDNGMAIPTEVYKDYIESIRSKRIPRVIVRGQHRIEGVKGCQIDIIHPGKKLLHNTKSDFNNNSIVMKISFRDKSILLCGDIEEEGLEILLQNKALLSSDIIKVPHHGSALNEIGVLFFNAVNPRIAIISVDEDNPSGLPDESTIDTLKELGAKILTTADKGAILIEI